MEKDPKSGFIENGGGWHYQSGDRSVGPVGAEEILRLAQTGFLHGDCLVWRAGFSDWTPLRLTELSALLSQLPPFGQPAGSPKAGPFPGQTPPVSSGPPGPSGAGYGYQVQEYGCRAQEYGHRAQQPGYQGYQAAGYQAWQFGDQDQADVWSGLLWHPRLITFIMVVFIIDAFFALLFLYINGHFYTNIGILQRVINIIIDSLIIIFLVKKKISHFLKLIIIFFIIEVTYPLCNLFNYIIIHQGAFKFDLFSVSIVIDIILGVLFICGIKFKTYLFSKVIYIIYSILIIVTSLVDMINYLTIDLRFIIYLLNFINFLFLLLTIYFVIKVYFKAKIEMSQSYQMPNNYSS